MRVACLLGDAPTAGGPHAVSGLEAQVGKRRVTSIVEDRKTWRCATARKQLFVRISSPVRVVHLSRTSPPNNRPLTTPRMVKKGPSRTAETTGKQGVLRTPRAQCATLTRKNNGKLTCIRKSSMKLRCPFVSISLAAKVTRAKPLKRGHKRRPRKPPRSTPTHAPPARRPLGASSSRLGFPLAATASPEPAGHARDRPAVVRLARRRREVDASFV